MTKPSERLRRWLAFPLLLFYSGLLVTAAWPVVLTPARPIFVAKLTSYVVLERLGIRPGLEVFSGERPVRDAPHMACFRIRGRGQGTVTLWDDLWRCARRAVSPVRDPFRIFQHRNLSRALVHLDAGGHRDLRRPPLRRLFAITDYYCHREEAVAAGVERIDVESVFVTWNVDDGRIEEHRMGGQRDCRSTRWRFTQ